MKNEIKFLKENKKNLEKLIKIQEIVLAWHQDEIYDFEVISKISEVFA